MTCEQCQEQLVTYLDNELSRGEAAEVDVHLRVCPHCRKELAEVRRFARAAHNATIPFREAVGRIEGTLTSDVRLPVKRHSIQGSLQWSLAQRRAVLICGGALCVAVALFLLLLPGHNRLDQVTAWAVQHYPLVDQVHQIRGDAGTVQRWFKQHHNVEIRPPYDVNYSELVGCKMTDFEAEPTPLLRFDGKQTTAVFILPVKFGSAPLQRSSIELSRNGHHVRMWTEEGTTYVEVIGTPSRSGS